MAAEFKINYPQRCIMLKDSGDGIGIGKGIVFSVLGVVASSTTGPHPS